MITHLLFDLDNTLYSSQYGLEDNVSRRINNYLVEVLNMPLAEVEKVRLELVQKGYGTTIEWLVTERGFTDIETYYAVINPEDEADSLPPDPELGELLASIPLQKAVFTNSAAKHAERILDKLGIRAHFNFCFDISFNNYRGKPRRDAFLRVLEAMNAEPGATLFIDDNPLFVEAFLKIGGKALLLDEEFDRFNNNFARGSVERIKELKEIKNFL